MKIMTLTCLIFSLIACASQPKIKMEESKKLLTPVRIEINCSLTCNNKEYLIPGGKMLEKRILPTMSKDVLSTILKITSAPDSKYSKEKKISLLSAIDNKKFNDTEKYTLFNFLALNYVSIGNHEKAVEYFQKVLVLSPNIAAFAEVQTYKSISQSYYQLGDRKNALTFFVRWVDYQTNIKSMDYSFGSLLFEETGDLNRAIANYARALEFKITPISEGDYQHLIDLYEINNDFKSAQVIRELQNKL